MAEATRPRDNPLHRGLPDEIAVWEILVRLPPKAVLRCRAVCPAWRRATSSRDFLLAHHARQPTLPLLYGYEISDGKYCQNILTFEHQTAAAAHPTAPLVNSAGEDGRSVHIVPFHHQTADLAPAMPPCAQPVTRLDSGAAFMNPEASCDGLLIHFECFMLSICNPATHQYAPLMQLQGFRLMGMYRHSPTGEYRLLLAKLRDLLRDLPPDGQDGSYVFTLGSSQPPRHIGYPEVEEVIHTSSVLFGGNLHWYVDQHLSESASNLIMVFDTTAELFRQMHAPAVYGNADLFEIGGMLGMASFDSFENTIIDVWVMQDYESQVWAFKCRIELPVKDLGLEHRSLAKVVVMAVDGELLVLVKTEDWLHYVDINGKLVASAYRRGILPTQLQLKQSLVPHAFFPTLEGYVVNDSPFI